MDYYEFDFDFYVTHTVHVLTINIIHLIQHNTNTILLNAPECHPQRVLQNKQIQVPRANLGTVLLCSAMQNLG